MEELLTVFLECKRCLCWKHSKFNNFVFFCRDVGRLSLNAVITVSM